MQKSETDDFTVKCEILFHSLKNDQQRYDFFLRTYNEYKVDNESGYGWPNYISIEGICNNADQYLKDNNTLTLKMKVRKFNLFDISYKLDALYIHRLNWLKRRKLRKSII